MHLKHVQTLLVKYDAVVNVGYCYVCVQRFSCRSVAYVAGHVYIGP